MQRIIKLTSEKDHSNKIFKLYTSFPLSIPPGQIHQWDSEARSVFPLPLSRLTQFVTVRLLPRSSSCGMRSGAFPADCLSGWLAIWSAFCWRWGKTGAVWICDRSCGWWIAWLRVSLPECVCSFACVWWSCQLLVSWRLDLFGRSADKLFQWTAKQFSSLLGCVLQPDCSLPWVFRVLPRSRNGRNPWGWYWQIRITLEFSRSASLLL